MSDHSPIIVKAGIDIHIWKPPFRYFNFWSDTPGFEDLVSLAWSACFDGSPQFILSQKLKALKQVLRNLNKQQFSNLQFKIEEARDKLINIQRQLNTSPGDEHLRSLEACALQDLIAMNKAEESFSRQKSRAVWMKEGDRNSKYFHGCMKYRINSNKILSLEIEDGSKIFKPVEIHSAAISHF